MDIQHQRFIGARFDRLDEGHHLMQLAVAVEAWVEVVRRTAANGGGKQLHALVAAFAGSLLMFGDNDQVGAGNGQARVLRRCLLDAAG